MFHFSDFPIFLIWYLGTFVVFFLRNRILRSIFLLALSLFSLAQVAYLVLSQSQATTKFYIAFHEFILFAPTHTNLVFAAGFSIVAFLYAIYSWHTTPTEHAFFSFYAGSAFGAIFCGDLLTFFIFLEMITFSSAFIIFSNAHTTQTRAFSSATRYLFFQIFAGMLMLLGIVFTYQENPSLLLLTYPHLSLGTLLILLGLCIKAAAFPFHGWLVDAYTSSSDSGILPLSVFTTKVAIYGLILMFPGCEILFFLGIITLIYPLLRACHSELYRNFSCRLLNSQLGLMIMAIGLGDPKIIDAVLVYAFVHILYDMCIFISTSNLMLLFKKKKVFNLPESLFRKTPETFITYSVGALSMVGMPFVAGFFGKGLLMHAIDADALGQWFYLLLEFSTILTMSLVLFQMPQKIFFRKSNKETESTHIYNNIYVRSPLHAKLTLFFASALTFVYGVIPRLYTFPFGHTLPYHPYTLRNISELSLLLVLAYVLYKILRLIPNFNKTLDKISAYALYVVVIESLLALCIFCVFVFRAISSFSAQSLKRAAFYFGQSKVRFFVMEWQGTRFFFVPLLSFLLLFFMLIIA